MHGLHGRRCVELPGFLERATTPWHPWSILWGGLKALPSVHPKIAGAYGCSSQRQESEKYHRISWVLIITDP